MSLQWFLELSFGNKLCTIIMILGALLAFMICLTMIVALVATTFYNAKFTVLQKFGVLNKKQKERCYEEK